MGGGGGEKKTKAKSGVVEDKKETNGKTTRNKIEDMVITLSTEIFIKIQMGILRSRAHT